jgi:hypothetical protein
MLFANITSGQAAVSTHVAVLLAAHVTSREPIGKRKDSHHAPAITGSSASQLTRSESSTRIGRPDYWEAGDTWWKRGSYGGIIDSKQWRIHNGGAIRLGGCSCFRKKNYLKLK